MISWAAGRFSRKLTLVLCLSLLGAMLLTDLVLTRTLRSQLVSELTSSLHIQAALIETQLIPSLFKRQESPNLQALAARSGKACACRVTLISSDGTVLADSNLSLNELKQVENHKERPEVRAALEGRKGHAIRRSETIGVDLLYAASPLSTVGKAGGVIRVALPLDQVQRKIAELRGTIASATLGVVLLAILASLWLSRSISRPVLEISRIAERLAQGDYGARISRVSQDEHGRLGSTLNLLAERVQSAIQELSKEKSQLSTILSNMVEAVVAVDKEGRILAVNPALCRLLSIEPSQALRKPFLEMLRHDQLSRILESVIRNCQENCDGMVEEVKLFTPEEHIFGVHAVPLMSDGGCAGGLLVLHDITRLRKLEQIRKDFVANVSHELRTPLSSIKGFAETLRSGGLEDGEHRLEFVEAIEKDAERMTRLVDDLLELSSIESGRRPQNLESVALLGIAGEVASSLRPLAERGRVSVEVRPSGNLPIVRADKGQMRQVLTNLLDNAIKFNKEGGAVVVSAACDNGFVAVSVSDTGSGIPADDLPRIFERFYRVDKARSRELGGTGLGLSIVKNIVEAHGGKVVVESRLSQGSVFRFSLPAAS